MLTLRVGEAGKCNIAFGNKLGMRFWRGADLHDDGYVTKKQFGSVFFFFTIKISNILKYLYV